MMGTGILAGADTSGSDALAGAGADTGADVAAGIGADPAAGVDIAPVVELLGAGLEAGALPTMAFAAAQRREKIARVTEPACDRVDAPVPKAGGADREKLPVGASPQHLHVTK